MCRKSCEELLPICGNILDIYITYDTNRFPEEDGKAYFRCKLQPQRNAGDSRECLYFNRHANITGKQYASTVFVRCVTRIRFP